MRHLLTTLAAAGLVMGLGLEVSPPPLTPPRYRNRTALIIRLRQSRRPATGMGIAATAITPIAATIGVPGITGPTTTAITGRIATAIGGGPIIAVTGSLAWIDQGRSASRWS